MRLLSGGEMEKSAIIYSLEPRTTDPNEKVYQVDGRYSWDPNEGGGTYYKDGKVIMEYEFGDYDAMSHEMKHGYQFEVGDISFSRSGGYGAVYDYTDEAAAWKRGSLFSTREYKPLTTPTYAELLKKGYSFRSKEALNINNTLFRILEASGKKPNKNNPDLQKTLKESGTDITN
jgi:hypothetical protein